MTKARKFVERFARELDAYRLMLVDPRTPWLARLMLGAGVAYLLSPLDIVPDFFPVVGHLDDVLIVGVLLGLGVRLIPASVRDDCRRRAGIRPDSAHDLHEE